MQTPKVLRRIAPVARTLGAATTCAEAETDIMAAMLYVRLACVGGAE